MSIKCASQSLFHCIDLIFFFSLYLTNFFHTIYFDVSPPLILPDPSQFPTSLPTQLHALFQKNHKNKKSEEINKTSVRPKKKMPKQNETKMSAQKHGIGLC